MPALSSELREKGEWHLGLAQKQDSIGLLLRESCPGYAITAIWYAAYHHVQAYLLLRFGRVVREHKEMRFVWRDYPDLDRGVRPVYETLKSRSEWFRYEGGEFTPAEVDVLRRDMERLRDFLSGKLRRSSPPPSSATPPPAPPP